MLDSNVNAYHIKRDYMWFVSREGTRNGEIVITIPIQNINEFLLLHCPNHNSSTLWICSKVVSWYSSSYSCLPKCFLVEFDQTCSVKFENNYASGIRADDKVVFLHAHKSEWKDAAYESEDFLSVD